MLMADCAGEAPESGDSAVLEKACPNNAANAVQVSAFPACDSVAEPASFALSGLVSGVARNGYVVTFTTYPFLAD